MEVSESELERIENSIQMNRANEPIPIYEGHFELCFGDRIFPIKGKIEFEWQPKVGAVFTGKLKVKNEPELAGLIQTVRLIDIRINKTVVGQAENVIQNFLNFNSEVHLKGRISGTFITGDKSIPVDKIKFSVPNLRDFYGDRFMVKLSAEREVNHFGRLNLENEEFRITLDKSHTLNNRFSDLNRSGGYLICYDGEITMRNNNSCTYNEVKDILCCLGTFLSFLNGRRTHPLFISGYFESSTPLWADYTSYSLDPFRRANSWPSRTDVSGANEIWVEFTRLWKKTEDRAFLKTFIDWYSESNRSSGFLDGSLIMAQTALELLYNWWIVERLSLIIGKDSQDIGASNKIRLLLSQVGINSEVPKGLKLLNEYIRKHNNKTVDGPEAIVQMRNAIVHSQRDKREELKNLSGEVKKDFLQLCIWYMELSLLKILGYQGKYFNRCSDSSCNNEYVPWIQMNDTREKNT